jgi:putative ABC transport system permease protein
MRIPHVFESGVADARFAARGLVKTPGFLTVVILSLALGIAANSTIYSVLNALIFRPLPYPSPERLMVIWQTERAHPDSRQAPPIAENVDWRKQNQVFEDIALISFRDTASVSGLGEARPMRVVYATPNLFALLGAGPILGRVFRAEEAQDHAQTVMISSEFWDREFHRDPNVLGKSFAIEGVLSTVAGVMQPRFSPFFGGTLDIWIPINAASGRYSTRIDHWLMPVGRLKAGVSLERAQAEMDVIARRMAEQYPATNKGLGIKVAGLQEDLVRGAKQFLYPLLGAVAFVLLIACVNVANLMQFRTETRRKEYALRVSLGAGRWRLVRQLFTESVVLALTGGALGIALTFAGIKLLLALAGDFPNAPSVNVDGRVLLFTLLISLATAVLVGLWPAIQTSKPNLNMVLRESERKTTSISSRMARHGLAVCEVALAMVLLAGAGLMVNTMMHLRRVSPGFDPSHLLTMETQLPEGGKYVERVPGGDMEKTLPTVTSFYERLLEKAKAVPGVISAAVIGALPTRCCPEFYSFAILKHAPPPDQDRPHAGYSEVSASVFGTMGIPLVKGRLLDEHDSATAPWAIVINETLARRYFPNEDPIGQQIRLRYEPYPVDEERAREIVGVVGDVKHFSVGQETPPFIYAPFVQQPAVFPGGAARAHLHKALVLKTATGVFGTSTNTAEMVKKTIAEIDADQPVTNIMTMDEVLSLSLGDWRFYMQLLLIFAAVAVLLAAVGIYGVMSYSVDERQHEIGVRVALGAHRRDILGMVAGLGLKLTLLGIVIGAGMAFGLMRLIATVLFGVKPGDPLTYSIVAVALVTVALVACYVPARRATRVDPIVALRHE